MSTLTSVRTPFGLLNGRIVAPAEVPSGLACECVCPGCGALLIARKGTLAWCFAHRAQSGSKNCVETAIHAAGKQALLDTNALVVPGYRLELTAISADGEVVELTRELGQGRRVRFDRTESEVAMPGIRPDVVGYRGDRALIVEILVTHAVDLEKQKKLDALAIPALEIDLSDLIKHGAALDLNTVRARVVDELESKRWLFYPGAVAAAQEMRAELALMMEEHERQAAQYAELARRRTEQSVRFRMDQTSQFRNLPVVEKERRVAEALNIAGAWPEYLAHGQFDTPALDTPHHIWQAMLFDTFVCQRRGGEKGFSVDEVEPWAREWIGISDVPGRDPGAVLRAYVAFLAARRFLVRCETRGAHTPTRYNTAPPDVVRVLKIDKTNVMSPQNQRQDPQKVWRDNWVWCDPWPRRGEIRARAIEHLTGSADHEKILAALDEFWPLNRPEVPSVFVEQLEARGVSSTETLTALNSMRLAVLSTTSRR